MCGMKKNNCLQIVYRLFTNCNSILLTSATEVEYDSDNALCSHTINTVVHSMVFFLLRYPNPNETPESYMVLLDYILLVPHFI